MFYILMLIGSGLILLGLKNRRKQESLIPEGAVSVVEKVADSESFGFAELKGRIEQLEKIVFQNMLSQEEKKAEAELEQEEAKASKEPQAPKQPMPDSIRALLDYESQGLSLQEIANLTRMNKGEVLLLKNLSKHYSR